MFFNGPRRVTSRRVRIKKEFDTSVLVLTNERDFAADDVIRHLSAGGIRTLRLNIEQAVGGPVPTWSPTESAEAPSVVWWRQFSLDESPKNLVEADDALVQRLQWGTWLSTLDRPSTRWVNPLWAARKAENKAEQLRTAAAIGFSIPRILITNSREAAAEFRSDNAGRTCIIKSLATAYFEISDQSFVFSQLLTPESLAAESDAWFAQPVVVQEAILGGDDVRLFVFGDTCFAARTPQSSGRALDWRLEQDVVWAIHDPPDRLVRLCRKYLGLLRLRYAAFDFVLAQGTYWFLEANQAGEWAWLDRQLGMGIPTSFAGFLRDLAIER